jgi:hypothetical protein
LLTIDTWQVALGDSEWCQRMCWLVPKYSAWALFWKKIVEDWPRIIALLGRNVLRKVWVCGCVCARASECAYLWPLPTLALGALLYHSIFAWMVSTRQQMWVWILEECHRQFYYWIPSAVVINGQTWGFVVHWTVSFQGREGGRSRGRIAVSAATHSRYSTISISNIKLHSKPHHMVLSLMALKSGKLLLRRFL